MKDDIYITPQQAARRMNVTPQTVYGWIRKGHLKARRVGPKMWGIKESDVVKVRRG